jgi:hypothetical protein
MGQPYAEGYQYQEGYGGSGGDLADLFRDDSANGGFDLADLFRDDTAPVAQSVAQGSDAGFDWGDFANNIISIIPAAASATADIIAALGKGQAAGTIEGSSRPLSPYEMAALQRAYSLQAMLPAFQQQQVASIRDLQLMQYARQANQPQAYNPLSQQAAWIEGQASGRLDTQDILLIGALGLGAVFLLSQMGGRRR